MTFNLWMKVVSILTSTKLLFKNKNKNYLQVWVDPRLQWESEEHDGIEVVTIGSDELWTPDISDDNV